MSFSLALILRNPEPLNNLDLDTSFGENGCMARDYRDRFEGLIRRVPKKRLTRPIRKVSDVPDTSSPMPAACDRDQSAEFLNTGRMAPVRVAEL
jgi:hypothetical protein